MNLTFSIDKHTAARARLAAQAMGKSLNELVHEYLAQLAGRAKVDAEIAEFVALCGLGDSRRPSFDRESLYAERLGRFGDAQ